MLNYIFKIIKFLFLKKINNSEIKYKSLIKLFNFIVNKADKILSSKNTELVLILALLSKLEIVQYLVFFFTNYIINIYPIYLLFFFLLFMYIRSSLPRYKIVDMYNKY